MILAVMLLPGGAVVGGWIGMLLSAATFVPQLIMSPASAGGTGSVDITMTALVIGAVIGASLGGFIGAAMASVVGLLWCLHVPAVIVSLVASIVSGCAVVALLTLVVGPDPQTLSIAALGVTHLAGAGVALAWLGSDDPAVRRVWRAVG